MRTVEAIIQPSGEVRLVEPVHVLSPRRALVTILEEEPQVHDTARLSEAALAEDWNRPEEDVWTKAIATSPAFDFLKDAAENIYTAADGKPFHDQG
jgi:hypothetical protein